MGILQCVESLNGFTKGRIYEVLSHDANYVIILDDKSNIREFNKIEGDSDFKNWFLFI